MPQPTYAIPSVFNTLDDLAFQDGRPVSAWTGRETTRNDRYLHAVLRRCFHNMAWDLEDIWTVQVHEWVTVAWIACHTTPRAANVTVRGRSLITSGYDVYVAVGTLARPYAWSPDAEINWATVTGTGAAQDWQITVPVRLNQPELIEVMLFCELNPSEAVDVNGDVLAMNSYQVESNAGQMAGIAVGWAIQLYDGAAASANEGALTSWHTIVTLNGDRATIQPPFQPWEQAAGDDESGRARWRARQIASCQMRSLAVDEDALTGQL